MKKLTMLALLASAGMAHSASWTFTLDGGQLASIENPGVVLTGNGNITYGVDTINGQVAQVANLTQNGSAALDPYFSLANPIGPNGGGTRTNRYSILIDIKVPVGDFHSLLQTGSTHSASGSLDSGVNANDGDWFLNGNNGLGISGDYGDAGNSTVVSANQWNRLVLTIDTATATGNDIVYRSYVNGVLQNVVQSPSSWGQNGRYSLGSVFAFFADEDSELRSPFSVNNLVVFDSALSEQQVAGFGGATASAPVPEPATLAALSLGVIAILRKRRA